MANPRPAIVRFFEKVNTEGELRVETPCWEWRAARNRDGYGEFHLNDRLVRAHIYSYELTFGPVPAGLLLMHRCDFPPCVNPSHVAPGTGGENCRDKTAKGRHGLRGKRWRISEVDRVNVLSRVARGMKREDICKELLLCRRSIQRIVSESRKSVNADSEKVHCIECGDEILLKAKPDGRCTDCYKRALASGDCD